MTNGRGQVETIRQNIFAKYGRYQVHPKKQADNPEPSLRDQILQRAANQQATANLSPQQTKALVVASLLQDIHDRNDK